MVIKLLAIDPGARYCGIAWLSGLQIVKTTTVGPKQLVRILEGRTPGLWVVEEYRLYPWVAQPFSEVKTAKLIGVIEYLAGVKDKEVVAQPAYVRKVAEGHCRVEGIRLRAGDRHAKDAQLHGLYWVLRRQGAIRDG